MSAPARDPRGVPVGTRSAEALRHAEQGLWRMVSFFGDPLPDLEAAAQADPHWMLPPVMQAGFLLSLTEAPLRAQAQPLLERALARREGAPPREQAHLDAVRLGWQGDWAGACARWDEILLEHPRDLLALLWAHLFDFHRGDAWQLRQRVARVLPQWDAADPLYPYVLGMRAFGLEETHHHAEAEAVGRRALEGGTPVAWAVHAVAHVMEMQGRVDEGAAWLARHQPQWVDNGLAVHLWWHLGLFRLERLDTEGALRLVCTRGPEHGGPGTVYATLAEVPEPVRRARHTGITVATLPLGVTADARHGRPWLLAGHKTTSYAPNQAARRWAAAHGVDDVLWVSTDGYALEGPSANLVWLAGDTLCTVPADTGILPGITADWLLGRAAALGWTAARRRISPAELHHTDGAWFTSSVRGLAEIRALDGVPLPASPHTPALRDLLGLP